MVGFEKENIEALCSIGKHEEVKYRTKDYIDEKGIGFKLVFKVENIVNISSKAYSFRLDPRSILGMIGPIIKTFLLTNLIGRREGQS